MSEHDVQAGFFVWVRANENYNKDIEIKRAMGVCFGIGNGGKRPQKLTPYGKKMIQKYGRKPPKHISRKGWYYSTVGNTMKEEGLTEGIPDVFLSVRTKEYPGMYIEFKYRKIPLSDNLMIRHRKNEYIVDLSDKQKEKRELFIRGGYKYVICYHVQEAKDAVITYLPFNRNEYIEV